MVYLAVVDVRAKGIDVGRLVAEYLSGFPEYDYVVEGDRLVIVVVPFEGAVPHYFVLEPSSEEELRDALERIAGYLRRVAEAARGAGEEEPVWVETGYGYALVWPDGMVTMLCDRDPRVYGVDEAGCVAVQGDVGY